MINLLIVDDEKLTREGLLDYVDWSSMEVTGVFLADSGDEALKLMETQSVNILLCDIRMPRMNGIELATRVRELYPDCRIIFLSGYSDKEYLKAAILLKAESYIEKPVDIEELSQVITDVVSRIKQDISKKQSDQILVSGLVETFPIVQQEIALELISDRMDYTAFKAKYFPLYFTWNEHELFTAVCIHPDVKLDYWKKTRDLINKVYSFLESSTCPVPLDFYAGQTEKGNIAVLIKDSNRTALQQNFAMLQQILKETFDLSVTIGISPTCRELREFPGAYVQAKNAVEQSFYLGQGQIIGTPGGTHTHLLDISLFSQPNIQFEAVTQIFEELERQRYTDIPNVRKHLYQLYKTMMELTLNDNLISFDEFEQNNLTQMRELTIYGMRALRTLGDDLYDVKIKDAIHYILWNYNNFNLNIKTIADHVELSQNYLCTLFKQNTHITINDFILQVRVEKTKKLLKTTDLKLYEIADRVGVADANYLSALFRRCCGQTPSQYRQIRS